MEGGSSPSANSRISPTAEQIALVRDLARGVTRSYPGISFVPASVYTSPEHWLLEKQHLFGRLPQVLCPSALLSEPNMVVPHGSTGANLLITRDAAGLVHVFRNTCRHRGTTLVEGDEVQCISRMSCPYHAWTYATDGRLVALPRSETFPGLNKAEYGLVELPSCESGGLIWFSPVPADFSHAEAVGRDFAAAGVDRMHVYRRQTHRVAANWKLIMDAFLESYHVQRLHANSVGKYFRDQDGLLNGDHIGPHTRSVSLIKHNDPTGVDMTDWTAFRAFASFAYQLFPATVLVLHQDCINFMTIMPQSHEATLVEDFLLIPQPARTEKEEDHWRRNWELLDGVVFGAEDFRAAELGQKGLASGAVERLTLGTLEGAVGEFHQTCLSHLPAAG